MELVFRTVIECFPIINEIYREEKHLLRSYRIKSVYLTHFLTYNINLYLPLSTTLKFMPYSIFGIDIRERLCTNFKWRPCPRVPPPLLHDNQFTSVCRAFCYNSNRKYYQVFIAGILCVIQNIE